MNKQIILTIILATLTINAVAQSVDSIHILDNTILSINGKLTNPEFPGGKKGLMKFLSKNVTYPKEAASYDVEGSVIMVFIINESVSHMLKNGKIIHPKCIETRNKLLLEKKKQERKNEKST